MPTTMNRSTSTPRPIRIFFHIASSPYLLVLSEQADERFRVDLIALEHRALPLRQLEAVDRHHGEARFDVGPDLLPVAAERGRTFLDAHEEPRAAVVLRARDLAFLDFERHASDR